MTSWNKGAEIEGKTIVPLVAPGSDSPALPSAESLAQRGRVHQFDSTVTRKDGTQILVTSTLSLIEDPRGRIVGRFAIKPKRRICYPTSISPSTVRSSRRGRPRKVSSRKKEVPQHRLVAEMAETKTWTFGDRSEATKRMLPRRSDRPASSKASGRDIWLGENRRGTSQDSFPRGRSSRRGFTLAVTATRSGRTAVHRLSHAGLDRCP